MPAKRKKRKKRRKNLGRFFVLLMLVIAAVAVTLTTPVFNIIEVTVSGNEKLDANDIKLASGIAVGSNIFKISTRRAEKNIAKISYVEAVDVVRKLPTKISIKITEAKICGYIKCKTGVVGIDKNGKAIEALPTGTEVDKYMITGAQLTKFELGEKISIDETKIADIILIYMNAFEEFGISENIAELKVSSLVDTSFITRSGLVVKLGAADELSYKLKYYKRILEEIGKEESGILDMTVTDKVTYRKH